MKRQQNIEYFEDKKRKDDEKGHTFHCEHLQNFRPGFLSLLEVNSNNGAPHLQILSLLFEVELVKLFDPPMSPVEGKKWKGEDLKRRGVNFESQGTKVDAVVMNEGVSLYYSGVLKMTIMGFVMLVTIMSCVGIGGNRKWVGGHIILWYHDNYFNI